MRQTFTGTSKTSPRFRNFEHTAFFAQSEPTINRVRAVASPEQLNTF